MVVKKMKPMGDFYWRSSANSLFYNTVHAPFLLFDAYNQQLQLASQRELL